MAIFSGKIVDAYYTDEKLSNVTVLYNYEKDGDTLVGQYNLVVDETEEQFQDLLKEWSYADIEIATIELHKEMRKQYEDAIEEEVKAIAKQREESRRLLVADDHFQIFFNYNAEEHADHLFKAKMYLFSLDVVKSSTANFRTKIRKAETILELGNLYSQEKKRLEKKAK